MVISYDAYRTFYTVAKLGSFTRAANALMSSQPNLTRTIRNLESVLGCTLFVRSNRGVSLTPEGEKLFARVSVACEQIQAGEEELMNDRGLKSGVISIGRKRNRPAQPASARARRGSIALIRASACASPTIPCAGTRRPACRTGGSRRRHLAAGRFRRAAHRYSRAF